MEESRAITIDCRLLSPYRTPVFLFIRYKLLLPLYPCSIFCTTDRLIPWLRTGGFITYVSKMILLVGIDTSITLRV